MSSEEFDETDAGNYEVTEEEQEFQSPRRSAPSGLKDTFLAFSRFGKGRKSDARQTRMDGKAFAKVSKDAKLLQPGVLTSTDIDLIFARVKQKGQRTISFREFKDGLREIAAKCDVEAGDIFAQVAKCGGPAGLAVTTPDAVRLHDDKSTYTGVYARGGPSTTDRDTNITLEYLMDRTPYDVRGRKIAPRRAKELVAEERKQASRRYSSPRRTRKTLPEAPEMERDFERDLKRTFFSFCRYGEGSSTAASKRKDLDNAKFVKLARDSNLVCDDLPTRELDLIFTKVKERTARRINFAQFKVAIVLIAEKVDRDFADIAGLIIQAGGPITNATEADYVQFHDDKSTYTGVYARGGPTTIDNPAYIGRGNRPV